MPKLVPVEWGETELLLGEIAEESATDPNCDRMKFVTEAKHHYSRALAELDEKNTLPQAVRYEDTIKQPEEEEVEPEPVEEEGSNGFPDISKHDRLGWSLARLQRALSNVPRRRSGNTESWHRARITPELTISARNLADVDAHLLDSVSRMLKQLLWEAWEE